MVPCKTKMSNYCFDHCKNQCYCDLWYETICMQKYVQEIPCYDKKRNDENERGVCFLSYSSDIKDFVFLNQMKEAILNK